MELCAAETWGMRRADSRKVNALEMKCLRSLVGARSVQCGAYINASIRRC